MGLPCLRQGLDTSYRRCPPEASPGHFPWNPLVCAKGLALHIESVRRRLGPDTFRGTPCLRQGIGTSNGKCPPVAPGYFGVCVCVFSLPLSNGFHEWICKAARHYPHCLVEPRLDYARRVQGRQWLMDHAPEARALILHPVHGERPQRDGEGAEPESC